MPKPTSIMAQVVGSGTAATGARMNGPEAPELMPSARMPVDDQRAPKLLSTSVLVANVARVNVPLTGASETVTPLLASLQLTPE